MKLLLTVTIDRPQGGWETLAEVMRRVSTGVNLTDLVIRVLTITFIKADVILFETEDDNKTVLLKGKIREVVGVSEETGMENSGPHSRRLDCAEADEVASGMVKLGVPLN